jgi:hypothetical protein
MRTLKSCCVSTQRLARGLGTTTMRPSAFQSRLALLRGTTFALLFRLDPTPCARGLEHGRLHVSRTMGCLLPLKANDLSKIPSGGVR